MRSPNRTAKSSFATIFFSLLLAVVPGVDSGRAATYSVTHNYNLHLTTTNIYRGAWAWSEQAHAVDPPLVDNQSDSGTLTFINTGADVKTETAIAGRVDRQRTHDSTRTPMAPGFTKYLAPPRRRRDQGPTRPPGPLPHWP